MSKILTITLNPTVDLSTSTQQVTPGEKLRCKVPTADPGGGGINVSRAIRHLGGGSTAFVALGGANGLRLSGLLADHKIPTVAFPVPGETRHSLAVTDTASGQQYRFVMPGPDWTSSLVSEALLLIEATLVAGNIVILSGSQPPGVGTGFAARLADLVRQTTGWLVADTSGAPLRHLVDHPGGIDILRMDRAEAQELAGRALSTRQDTADFAASLVNRAVAGVVMIARGSDGTTLVSADERLHCSRAVENVVSAVGAGDSFVGGFTWALVQGASHYDALRHGTAAASAAVLTPATQLCTRMDAERLLGGCEVVNI